MTFKAKYPLSNRIAECIRVREKYPDRIPIICERNWNSKIQLLDKSKFLVPHDFTLGQFMYTLRIRLQLPCEKALFIFINGTLQPINSGLSILYDTYKDNDGFLYLAFSEENVFG